MDTYENRRILATSTVGNSEDSQTTSSIKPSTTNLLSCGLVSGLLQAALFNPWDRALYLAQTCDRKFLDLRNFDQPMKGVTQTLAQRSVSAGLYFPLEQIFRDFVSSSSGSSTLWVTFIAGNFAGAINGIIMNPVSAVKYHYWGNSDCVKENFLSTAISMFKKGGYRPFMVGATATITRDLIFGGFFALLRHDILAGKRKKNRKRETSFLVDLISGSIATVASSPFNYVRNIHYATPPDQKPLHTRKILSNLWADILAQKTYKARIFHIQSQLRLGWGTARVGAGMAFSSQVFSFLSSLTSY